MLSYKIICSLFAITSAVLSKAVPTTDTLTESALTLIDRALKALGGEEAIGSLRGVTFYSPRFDLHDLHFFALRNANISSIYRSRSLMQSCELDRADIAIAISGSQNISFSFESGDLTQRIDRKFTPSSEPDNT